MMHKVPGLNTTTGGSDLVRLKEEKTFGINAWDVLFQFFLPQADTTTNKLNQHKLITGRHRDKDILSCEKANTGRHQDMISFPVETQTSQAGIETKISFPVIETTTTARQDLIGLLKRMKSFQEDLCILAIWTDTNSIKKACCLEYREH
jgi:hypothetical protein